MVEEAGWTTLEQRVGRLEEAVAALQEKSRPDPPQVKVGAAPRAEAQGPETAQERDQPRARPGLLPWLLVDILGEARAMVRMFFDMHYQVAWYTRGLVLLLLVMILTSAWWFPLAWIIGGSYLDKLADLLLAFLAYKVLSREAQRYRDAQKP